MHDRWGGATGRRSGFCVPENRYTASSKISDPLEKLLAVMKFEAFHYRLDKVLNRSDRAKGGRLSFKRFLCLSLADKAPDAKLKNSGYLKL